MRKIFMDYIQTEGLLEQGDSVVIGVSGGADSVCLFLFLKEISKAYGLSLGVVHVEHGIRGRESGEDAAFVGKLCKKWGVDCQIVPVDVPALAKRRKCGEEEAGRLARQQAYVDYGRQRFGRCFKVALGHHMDDAAETMLFSLARGTGLAGLCGIRPKSSPIAGQEGVTVIHPLLGLRRQQIEEELRRRGEEWRTDATNAGDDYARNRLRHHVIPELAGCNDRAVWHLAETAAQMRGVESYIMEQAAAAYEKAAGEDGGLDRAAISGMHPALAGEVIRLWLSKGGVSRLGLSRAHLEAVQNLASAGPGKRADLPGGWRVVSGYSRLVLEKEGAVGPLGGNSDKEEPVVLSFQQLKAGVKVSFGGWHFAFSLLDREEFDRKIGQNRLYHENFFSICANYDKIDDVCLRFPLPEERIVIAKDGRSKSIRRLWIDSRIERGQRGRIPAVCDGAQIIWVVGVRDCPLYFVEDGTKQILLGKAWRDDNEREDQGDDSGGGYCPQG